MKAASVFLGILFIMTGVLCFRGTLLGWLQPWKAMPPEEKKKIRVKPLCRNFGEMITLFGILFFINGVWPGFQQHSFAVSMVAWLLVAVFDIVYAIYSSRYHEK